MKRGSTFVLKGTIILMGLSVLAILIFAFPPAIRSDVTGMYGPILMGMYVTAIPFFIALYQAMKLLGFIDRGTAFSVASVTALQKIKFCALSISAMYALGMPYIFYVADLDDAPGAAAMGFMIIFASLVIATFAAVLQRLLHDALAIKSENDLTV